MNQASQVTSLGDSVLFASLAYIAVLFPWAILIAHDFISDRWDTIRNTKKSGRWHIFGFILAPLLVSYIVLQPLSNEPDFKEMFTAITAFLFGIYHFLRSLVGLLELDWFQKWAKKVATLMERGGYWQKLEPMDQGGDQGQTREQKNQLKIMKWIASLYHRQKAEVSRHNSETLDTMKVNNSIVDNELAGSQSPNVAYILRQRRVHSFVLLFWKGLTKIFGRKGRDVVEAKLTTFVRWAVAFLAQYGNNWLEDVADTALVPSELRRTNKRREFAVKVLAAATLRMEKSEEPLRSHLPLGAWKRIFAKRNQDIVFSREEFTKQNEDIVFSREEFARASLETSFHMPGNVPVLTEEQSNERVHRERISLDYRHLFDPLITEAQSSLHPTMRESLQRHGKFSSQQLEWFAAFLCTQFVIEDNQNDADVSKFDNEDNQNDTDVSKGAVNSSSFGPQPEKGSKPELKSSIREQKRRQNENATTVSLLRSQLGLEDNVASRTFFYPFLKDAYERHFWENRAILEVSARVDNWIAICSGRHVSVLLEKQPFWETRKFRESHGDLAGYPRVSCAGDLAESPAPESCYHESGSDEDKKNIDWSGKIFDYHRKLENETLKYQLIDEQAAHWHMEQGLSFLGCVVESVRSALAEQSFLSGSYLQGWCPKLPDETITFYPTKELWNCISLTQDFDTAVQERLLWECQNKVHSLLSEKITRRDKAMAGGFAIHKEVEMMLLFLMGFPSILISRDSQDMRAFTIKPVLAPQPLQVHVLTHEETRTAVLQVQTTEKRSKGVLATDRFCWRDWRDAFEGRLHGKLEWQQHHFLPGAKLTKGPERRQTLARRTKGIWPLENGENPPLLWEGWTPFRPGMAIFELKHVLSPKEMEADKDDSFKRHKSVTQTYHDEERTTLALLSAAMLRLDVLLGHGEDLNKLDKDLKKLKERNDSPNENEGSSTVAKWISQTFRADPPPDQSGDNLTETKKAAKAEKLLDDLLKKSKAFTGNAMYDLALRLDSSKFATPEIVFNLMQGALHITRTEQKAESVINKLLIRSSSLSTQKRQEAIEKARHAVDILWLDVEARHKKKWSGHARQMDREKVDIWYDQLNGDKERLTRIIELHTRILKAHPTGTMMNELAERITRYGALRDHENIAIQLYESAIIANADPRPILKLATIYASRTFPHRTDNDRTDNDRTYACSLLKKALFIAKSGPHDDILDGRSVRLQDEFAVMEELYELAKSEDRGADWLFTKQCEVLRKVKDEIGHKFYKRLRGFLQDRKEDDEYAKKVIGSDEYRTEEDENARDVTSSDHVLVDINP